MPADIKTINDFFNLLGRVVLYAGSIAAAVAGIWALIAKIRSRGAMAKMDTRVSTLEKHVANDHEEIKKLKEASHANVEEFNDLHAVSRLTLSAVQQLLKSNLENGNNHAGMQRANDEIDEYLKSKI